MAALTLHFVTLVSMELWECGLSGTIPTELGSISKLSKLLLLHDSGEPLCNANPDRSFEGTLALATNQLTSTIPTELGRLKLTGLWLSENQLIVSEDERKNFAFLQGQILLRLTSANVLTLNPLSCL